MKTTTKRTLARREFLGAAGAAVAVATIVPRCAVAASGETPPSEKLRIAGIGIGGQGAGDLGNVGGENIVALCDVDLRRGGDSFKRWPAAKQFRDFRKMFDEMEKQIDAVVVATPDHTHAVAAMAAIKRGKHVYCEKPLAHSVYEVRQLMRGRGRAQGRHATGQPGAFVGHDPHVLRVDLGRRDRQGAYDPRGLRVDELASPPPAVGGLAARARRRSTGTCGSARRSSGRTIRPICRVRGAAGCPSATARSATGPATSSIRSSGHWTSAPRPRSRPK